MRGDWEGRIPSSILVRGREGEFEPAEGNQILKKMYGQDLLLKVGDTVQTGKNSRNPDV